MKAYLFALIASLFIANLARADEIDTLNARLKSFYISTVDVSTAASLVSSQLADGSWADIDYNYNSVMANWPGLNHLTRLVTLAAAYNKSGTSTYQNAGVKTAISKGLDFWFLKDIVHVNWYSNIISGPSAMAKVLLLMESQLTVAQINNGIEYANDGKYWEDKPQSVGQNRVWIAGVFVHLNALKALHNATEVAKAFTYIGGEVDISGKEGIKQDFSFQQHGEQLYNVGYGQAFMADIAFWMSMANGLSVGFTQLHLDTFSSFILDGSQWMIRRNTWDYAAAGRGISRPLGQVVQASFKRGLDQMIALNTSRKAQFQAFKNHMAGTDDDALVGDKYFWNSLYHSHRRPNFYVGLKMCSTRVDCHEAGNDENLQGYYLSQGAMMIMRDGLEYDEIYPVWDWGRIPGVTSLHKDPAPRPGNFNQPGKATIAGGVSDGNYAAVGFGLNWEGVTGKKAWFYFRDEVVALGAGISGVTTATQPVYTSLNQVLKRGNIYAGYNLTDSGLALSSGTLTLSNPKWVHHDHMGYVFPTTNQVRMKNANQSGSWYEINKVKDKTVLTKEVFSLWLDHGKAPTGGSYQYILLPGVELADMPVFVNANPIKVLVNSSARQAVRNEALKVTGAIFYGPGTITVRSGLVMKSDQTAAVIIDESLAGSVKLSVASPEAKALTVNITLSGAISKTVQFVLPSGWDAGKTVTQTVSTAGGGAGTLNAIADTFVFFGAGTTSYGTNNCILAKYAGTSVARLGYMKFDTASFTGTLTSAKLRIHVKPSGFSDPGTAAIYAFTNSTWTEAMTYKTRPSESAKGAQQGATFAIPMTAAEERNIDIDVTAFVKAQRTAGANVVSFILRSLENDNSAICVTSRETSTPPQLILSH